MKCGPNGLFYFAKILGPKLGEYKKKFPDNHVAIGVTGSGASWKGFDNTYALSASKFALRS